MLISQEASRRGIPFSENDVTDDLEARGSPRSDECIDFWPAVKTDAKTARPHESVYLRKGWLDPVIVIVIDYGLPLPRLVPRYVGRVGEYEID